MRKYIVLLWLLAPVGLVYFHYGPGQTLLAYDNAADLIKQAESLEVVAHKDSSVENWQKVVEIYQEANKILGEDNNNLITKRVKLSTANAMMYKGDLYESMTELKTLLQEAVEDEMPKDYTDQVRETLARCQFGAAWVMRLEGAETKDWTAQAEKARQNFRLLAEESLNQEIAKNFRPTASNSSNNQNIPSFSNKSDGKAASSEAIDHQKNLESTVRLEQLDASTIKGLPLPKEAQKNGKGKGLSDKMGEGEEGEGEGEGIGETKEGDARGKGAGTGQRWKGIGS